MITIKGKCKSGKTEKVLGFLKAMPQFKKVGYISTDQKPSSIFKRIDNADVLYKTHCVYIPSDNIESILSKIGEYSLTCDLIVIDIVSNQNYPIITKFILENNIKSEFILTIQESQIGL